MAFYNNLNLVTNYAHESSLLFLSCKLRQPSFSRRRNLYCSGSKVNVVDKETDRECCDTNKAIIIAKVGRVTVLSKQ